MPYVTIPTVVTGDIIPASHGNLLKANLDYHQGLLDGTGGAVTVTVPSALAIANDAAFVAYKPGATTPAFQFDTGDYMYYDRTANTWNFDIGSGIVLSFPASGKLTGTGFYSSGEFSVANNVSANVSHGLPARPRFVFGFYNTASGTENAKSIPIWPSGTLLTNNVRISAVTSTQISVSNDATGATIYAWVYAIL